MSKACIAYCQCRRAVGKTWGILPKVVAWLYTFVVRPILSFASLLCWTKSALSHLQRMTCLGIAGSILVEDVGIRSIPWWLC
jgi:hypothetical protein